MDRDIADLLATIDAQNARVADVQRAVERMEITGYAGSGEVTVRLRGTGQCLDVAIDGRTLRYTDPDSLGTLIAEAYNDGLRRLHEASGRAYAPLLAEASG
jgi:nucleoid-associated protein EbfC